MKLWIFDLDGTLADTFPVFFRSMREIFAARGRSVTDAQLRAALGSPMPSYFAEHFGEGGVDSAVDDLRRLSVAYAKDVRPFEGIEDCLEVLLDRGRSLAVWTARDRESTEHVLRWSGLDRFTNHVVTADCVSRGKPDPEGAHLVLDRTRHAADEAVMVGDHLHDVNAARAAGLLGVRASWNPYWKSEACVVADRQFFTVRDFADWIRAEIR
jgi:pyrophosphatase PpaX